MTATMVHLAVYDTMADWEVGYASAHINNPLWQRDPGRYRIVTVGESREPVTTMGGMRIVASRSQRFVAQRAGLPLLAFSTTAGTPATLLSTLTRSGTAEPTSTSTNLR